MLTWPVFLILSLSQAIGAFGWLLSIPGDPSSAIIFSFSIERVLLATIPIGVIVVSAGELIAYRSHKDFLRVNSWINNLRENSLSKNTFIGLNVVFSLVLISLPVSGVSEAVFQRLLPLICLAMLLSLEIGILCFYRDPGPSRHGNSSSLLVFAGLVGILAMLSGWASRELLLESRYYSGAGAPILPYQLIVTLYISAAVIIIPLKKEKLLTVALPILIFVLTAAIWSSAPIPINHFTHQSNLPSGNLIPYSDARIYDGNAQIMLLGHGLAGGNVLPRSLYSFLLGWIQVIFGTSLPTVLSVQTVLLALFPVTIYFLGVRLLHPAAGLAAALLLIFREHNQALLGSEYTLSSYRLLMSETLMAGLLAAFSVSTIKWLSKPESRTAALFTGALLGLAVLVRTQGLLLGGIVIAFLLLRTYRVIRSFIAPCTFFLLGLSLVLLPWMARNFINNGWFSIDDKDYRSYIPQATPITSVLSNDWTVASPEATPLPSPSPSGTQEPSELFFNSSPVATRQPSEPQHLAIPMGKRGALHLVSLFTNNNLSSLYQLPWKLDLNSSLKAYVTGEIDTPLVGNPQLSRGHTVVLLVHLLVISIGLASAWKKHRFVGLVPASIYLGYNLSSVAASYSGWRFIQPVDWVLLLYWAMGFVAIVGHLLKTNQLEPKLADATPSNEQNAPSFKLAMIIVLALGLLMPIGENILPKNEVPNRAALLLQIEQNATMPNTQRVFELASDSGSNITGGVLLYPELLLTERDYMLNKLDRLWPAGQLLTFNIVSNIPRWYYAPNFEQTTLVEHQMSVIVVSCEVSYSWSTPSEGPLPEAIAILVQTEQPYWFYVNQSIPTTCDE